jgi:hypothetical protein
MNYSVQNNSLHVSRPGRQRLFAEQGMKAPAKRIIPSYARLNQFIQIRGAMPEMRAVIPAETEAWEASVLPLNYARAAKHLAYF